MSSTAPCDRPYASPLDRRGTGAYNINAGIDSSVKADPAHRGTLSTPELELIHQSASYKKAMLCEEEDKLELAAKTKQLDRAQESDRDQGPIVETPFHLRARLHDLQTARAVFEVARENQPRTCQMYRFTVRRNNEDPHWVPEQNLTFWRNSLELTHLAAGTYKICAIICSERLKEHYTTNRSKPITACVEFSVHRPHFLFLTLYVLVFLILAFSQMVFTLRKRRFQATIKLRLMELEHNLQKWRSTQTSSGSTDRTQSCNISQSPGTHPAAPVHHSRSPSLQTIGDEIRPSYPITFHLNTSNEHLPPTKISEIP